MSNASSNSDSNRLPGHLNPANWFILIGVIVTVGMVWFLMGQPGAALKDGSYGCKTPPQSGISIGGPAATVLDGEVVDAWDFDMATGLSASVPYRNVERVNADSFTMTSVATGGHEFEFDCTFSE